MFPCRGVGLVSGVTYLYYAGFIEADEFSFGESGLSKEGLVPSLALFLLSWTTVFTGMEHGSPGVA